MRVLFLFLHMLCIAPVYIYRSRQLIICNNVSREVDICVTLTPKKK